MNNDLPKPSAPSGCFTDEADLTTVYMYALEKGKDLMMEENLNLATKIDRQKLDNQKLAEENASLKAEIEKFQSESRSMTSEERKSVNEFFWKQFKEQEMHNQPIEFLTAWLQVNNIFDPKDRELARKVKFALDQETAIMQQENSSLNAKVKELEERNDLLRVCLNQAEAQVHEMMEVVRRFIEVHEAEFEDDDIVMIRSIASDNLEKILLFPGTAMARKLEAADQMAVALEYEIAVCADNLVLENDMQHKHAIRSLAAFKAATEGGV